MNRSTAALAALLVAASLLTPAASGALPPACGPEDVCLEAARIRWDRGSDTGLAEGEVHLRARGLDLKTPRLYFDLELGLLAASLGAHLSAPWGELEARTLRVSLRGDNLEASDAHLNHQISSGRTLRLDAAYIRRIPGGVVLARRLEVTACGCQEGVPAWSLSAARARIDLDRGAFLLSPVMKLAGVPVLWLPAFYLPLGSRRSGLLIPKLGYSGRGGYRITQPLYLALGRSWDLTLEGVYRFGRAPEQVLGRRGERVRPGPAGPALGVELRYAPRRHTSGHLRVDYLHDLMTTGTVGQGEGIRGQRWRLGWRHDTHFGDAARAARAGFAANVQLASDAALISDLGLRLEERQVGYLRSSARVYHLLGREDVASSLEVGARYLQDLSSPLFGTDATALARPLFGSAEGGVPGTLQALPEVHWVHLPRPLLLGVLGGASLNSYTWLRPTGLSEAPEVEAFSPHLHLHGRARAERAFHLGQVLTGGVATELHTDLWQPWSGEAPALRAWPLLRAEVQSALEVREPTLRHRIVPSLEALWAPPALQQGEGSAIDAWSMALHDEGVAQAVAALSSRFTSRGTRVELSGRQGWDFRAGAPSEADARLRLQRGPLRMLARAAYAWPRRELSFAQASLSARGPFASRLGLSYVRLEPWASAWLRAGLSELFDGGATGPGILPQRIDELSLSLGFSVFPGLQTSYALRLDLGERETARLPQHVVGLTYEAPCKCLSLRGIAVWLPGQSAPEIRLALDLAGLGG
ncbi:MAG: hypothetical protein P1V51_03630 [Deltaproteobacteria bacterium]|nr:hypothetical protein [Deltaproteobacteria bacterium]